MAHMYELHTQKRLGVSGSDFGMMTIYEMFAHPEETPITGENFVKRIQDNARMPFNFIFVAPNNDIGHTITGRHPIRKHNLS
jgi:hypothetical protein